MFGTEFIVKYKDFYCRSTVNIVNVEQDSRREIRPLKLFEMGPLRFSECELKVDCKRPFQTVKVAFCRCNLFQLERHCKVFINLTLTKS